MQTVKHIHYRMFYEKYKEGASMAQRGQSGRLSPLRLRSILSENIFNVTRTHAPLCEKSTLCRGFSPVSFRRKVRINTDREVKSQLLYKNS